MLQSRSFVKKTKKGKVLKVVREHYLRDDIYSGSPLDPDCDQSAAKLSASAPHYLVVDTNIVLQQVSDTAYTALVMRDTLAPIDKSLQLKHNTALHMFSCNQRHCMWCCQAAHVLLITQSAACVDGLPRAPGCDRCHHHECGVGRGQAPQSKHLSAIAYPVCIRHQALLCLRQRESQVSNADVSQHVIMQPASADTVLRMTQQQCHIGSTSQPICPKFYINLIIKI